MEPWEIFNQISFNSHQWIQTFFVEHLPSALIRFFLGYVLVRFIQGLFTVFLRTAHVTKAMEGILQSTLSIILWIVVFALVFQSLGLSQIAIALSGSVAVIGLGIATGANKLVSDIIAGIFLAKSRDFKIGQNIKIAEVEGQIYSLDNRKVRILGKDGTMYIIPNTKFDEQVWQTLPVKEKESNEK